MRRIENECGTLGRESVVHVLQWGAAEEPATLCRSRRSLINSTLKQLLLA